MHRPMHTPRPGKLKGACHELLKTQRSICSLLRKVSTNLIKIQWLNCCHYYCSHQKWVIYLPILLELLRKYSVNQILIVKRKYGGGGCTKSPHSTGRVLVMMRRVPWLHFFFLLCLKYDKLPYAEIYFENILVSFYFPDVFSATFHKFTIQKC